MNRVWVSCKPSNMLYQRRSNGSLVPKATNFELTVMTEQKIDMSAVDLLFMPPEYFEALQDKRPLPAHPSLDVWSFGVALLLAVSPTAREALLKLDGKIREKQDPRRKKSDATTPPAPVAGYDVAAASASSSAAAAAAGAAVGAAAAGAGAGVGSGSSPDLNRQSSVSAGPVPSLARHGSISTTASIVPEEDVDLTNVWTKVYQIYEREDVMDEVKEILPRASMAIQEIFAIKPTLRMTAQDLTVRLAHAACNVLLLARLSQPTVTLLYLLTLLSCLSLSLSLSLHFFSLLAGRALF